MWQCHEMLGAFDAALTGIQSQIEEAEAGEDRGKTEWRELYRDLARLHLKRGEFSRAALALRRFCTLKTGRWGGDRVGQVVVAVLYRVGSDAEGMREALNELIARARWEGDLKTAAGLLREWDFGAEAVRCERLDVLKQTLDVSSEVQDALTRGYYEWARKTEEDVPNAPLLYEQACGSARELRRRLGFTIEDVAEWVEVRDISDAKIAIYGWALLSELVTDDLHRAAEWERFRGRKIVQLLAGSGAELGKLEWTVTAAGYKRSDNIVKAGIGTFIVRGVVRVREPYPGFALHGLSGGCIHLECEPGNDLCPFMKGGRVIIGHGVRLEGRKLGSFMEEGEIIVEGDFCGRSLGMGMKGGRILVKGSVHGPGSESHLDVGQSMEDGEIVIEGDCYLGGWVNALGCQMKGGRIIVKGDVVLQRGEEHRQYFESNRIGDSMSGGTIRVGGNVSCAGHLIVGSEMSGGDIRIDGNVMGSRLDLGANMHNGEICVEGRCGRGSIGVGMWRGRIAIYGDAAYAIGSSMRDGNITIGGDVDHDNGRWMEPVGVAMEGGRIDILGEVRYVHPRRRGGEVYHRGRRVEAGWWKRFIGDASV